LYRDILLLVPNDVYQHLVPLLMFAIDWPITSWGHCKWPPVITCVMAARFYARRRRQKVSAIAAGLELVLYVNLGNHCTAPY